jgi:hypothetical protein
MMELPTTPLTRLPDPGTMRAIAEWIGLAADGAEALIAAADAVAQSPGGEPRFVTLLADMAAAGPARVQLPADLGCAPQMLAALLVVTSVPRMRSLHDARAIPLHISQDTAGDIALWMRNYRAVHGRWGLAELEWLRGHLRDELYRIGRLQFRPGLAPAEWYFVEGPTGVMPLACEGLTVTEDGFLAEKTDSLAGQWKTTLERSGPVWHGYVAREGRMQRAIAQMPQGPWRLRMAPGAPILEVHIPAEQSLDDTACGESLARAPEFFGRFRPDVRCDAFTCHSWLLDPQLPSLLPRTGNIVRFQKRFVLHPAHGGAWQTADRVFGRWPVDPAAAPRQTSLQRALLTHLESGRQWRSGGGVILVK